MFILTLFMFMQICVNMIDDMIAFTVWSANHSDGCTASSDMLFCYTVG